jgi:hypothetical protein
LVWGVIWLTCSTHPCGRVEYSGTAVLAASRKSSKDGNGGSVERRVPAVLWLVLAIGCPVATIALLFVGGDASRRFGSFAFFTWPILSVIAAVLAERGFRRARRRQTAQEAAPAVRAANADGWRRGVSLFAELVNDRVPAPLTVWGLVLRPGENVHLDLPITYSRLYGQDVTYRPGSGFYIGSPGLVMACLFADVVADSVGRSRARSAAATCWRDLHTTRVIVTDQRLVCVVAGQWMSFDYNTVTGLHPDPRNWSVALEFDRAVPLLLQGPQAISIGIYLCWALNGHAGLDNHPALEPIRHDAERTENWLRHA